ncbi:MAG: glycosyltransferase [Candidatus Omnitrophica bacterium]|nr:glycosyltransferase [Candidatus Omnitrophota bacterium]
MGITENNLDVPVVSIIIPAYNAEQYIEKCLRSLQQLDYPKDKYEVIVIDNGSSDGTVKIVQHYSTQLWVEKGNISSLRNSGAKKSKGDILAFLDADCVAPSHWLREGIRLLENKTIGAVGSWYQLPVNTTLVERVWDLHMSSRREKIGDINWVPSGNLIMTKSVFYSIGGFEEDLKTSEDVDLCQRVRKQGLSVYAHPRLAVEHLGNPKTIKDFFIKEKWRGDGVLQNLIRKKAESGLNKAVLYSISTTLLLVLFIIGSFVWLWNGNSLFFMFSLLALLLVPLFLSLRIVISCRKWKYLPVLMFLFFLFGVSRSMSFFSFKKRF